MRGLSVTTRLYWKLRSNMNKINMYKSNKFIKIY
nr:MAG TPA: hypothetical protein [Caudoviricetes sp.]DAO64345.1 MAG TPA: hypothetical protein [Caudoviricetes sp.]